MKRKIILAVGLIAAIAFIAFAKSASATTFNNVEHLTQERIDWLNEHRADAPSGVLGNFAWVRINGGIYSVPITDLRGITNPGAYIAYHAEQQITADLLEFAQNVRQADELISHGISEETVERLTGITVDPAAPGSPTVFQIARLGLVTELADARDTIDDLRTSIEGFEQDIRVLNVQNEDLRHLLRTLVFNTQSNLNRAEAIAQDAIDNIFNYEDFPVGGDLITKLNLVENELAVALDAVNSLVYSINRIPEVTTSTGSSTFQVTVNPAVHFTNSIVQAVTNIERLTNAYQLLNGHYQRTLLHRNVLLGQNTELRSDLEDLETTHSRLVRTHLNTISQYSVVQSQLNNLQAGVERQDAVSRTLNTYQNSRGFTASYDRAGQFILIDVNNRANHYDVEANPSYNATAPRPDALYSPRNNESSVSLRANDHIRVGVNNQGTLVYEYSAYVSGRFTRSLAVNDLSGYIRAAVTGAWRDGYLTGYNEGYNEGYNAGYADGFVDGYDAARNELRG